MGTRRLREAQDQVRGLPEPRVPCRHRRSHLRPPLGPQNLGCLSNPTRRYGLVRRRGLDGSSWKEDAEAYLASCSQLGMSAYAEISRSGEGCHVWTFFDFRIAASKAR